MSNRIRGHRTRAGCGFPGTSIRLALCAAVLSITMGVASAATVVTSGEIVTVSGVRAQDRQFRISVPSGSRWVRLQTWGGTGDVTLFASFAGAPTHLAGGYQYRSGNPGTVEVIDIPAPPSGICYFMVRGYMDYANVRVRAIVPINISSGATLPLPAAVRDRQIHFCLTVPAGTSSLNVRTWGGTGDPSLFATRGSPPSEHTYDYRSNQPGTVDTITVPSPPAGDWYLMVRAHQAYSGVLFQATAAPIPAGVRTLVPGVRLTGNLAVDGTGVLSTPGTTAFFRLPTSSLPAGLTELVITSGGTTGDMDLYAGSVGTSPGSTSATGYSRLTGATSHHSIVMPAAQVATYAPGDIAFAVHSDVPGDYTLLAIARAPTVARKYIRTYMYTVGTTLSASIENSNPVGRDNLNKTLTEVIRIYEQTNPNITPVFEIRQWSGATADPYRSFDLGQVGEWSGLDAYTGGFPSSAYRPNGCHTFLVENIIPSNVLGASYVGRSGVPGSFGAANVVSAGASSFSSQACIDATYVVPTVIDHENGHYTGLGHDSAFYNLMYPCLCSSPGSCPPPPLPSRQDDITAPQSSIMRSSQVTR